MNFDSSTGCEREIFGHLQQNNRVGDALIRTINDKIFRSRHTYYKKPELYFEKTYAKYPVHYQFQFKTKLMKPS